MKLLSLTALLALALVLPTRARSEEPQLRTLDRTTGATVPTSTTTAKSEKKKKKKKKRKKKRKKKKKKSKEKKWHGEIRKPTAGLTFTPREGFVAPYSYENLFRGFDGGHCRHQALDIGGVGEHYGIGTPVVAIVDATVISIVEPEDNPKKYGKRDKRNGHEVRAEQKLPRKIKVEGYGTVYPFTRTSGSSRTGVMVTTQALGTDIDGYSVRYMHLAAPHPDLEPGVTVKAGQEIGLMGATGYTEDAPHVHIDIEKPSGVRVDVAPFLGLDEVRPSSCKPVNKRKKKKKKKKKKRRKKRRKKKKK